MANSLVLLKEQVFKLVKEEQEMSDEPYHARQRGFFGVVSIDNEEFFHIDSNPNPKYEVYRTNFFVTLPMFIGSNRMPAICADDRFFRMGVPLLQDWCLPDYIWVGGRTDDGSFVPNEKFLYEV